MRLSMPYARVPITYRCVRKACSEACSTLGSNQGSEIGYNYPDFLACFQADVMSCRVLSCLPPQNLRAIPRYKYHLKYNLGKEVDLQNHIKAISSNFVGFNIFLLTAKHIERFRLKTIKPSSGYYEQ